MKKVYVDILFKLQTTENRKNGICMCNSVKCEPTKNFGAQYNYWDYAKWSRCVRSIKCKQISDRTAEMNNNEQKNDRPST